MDKLRFIIHGKLHHLTLSPFVESKTCPSREKLEVELIDEPVWEQNWILLDLALWKIAFVKRKVSIFTESTPFVSIWMRPPNSKLIPADQKLRFETRRVTSWFDVSFIMKSQKIYFTKKCTKIFKIGQPDSSN